MNEKLKKSFISPAKIQSCASVRDHKSTNISAEILHSLFFQKKILPGHFFSRPDSLKEKREREKLV